MKGKQAFAAVGVLILITLTTAGWLVGCRVESEAQSASSSGKVVVLCSSCSFEGLLPRKSHIILMDSQSGEIWAYSDEAVVGTGEPVYVGTLTRVGMPVTKTH